MRQVLVQQPCAAAAADVDHPAKAGLLQAFGVFIDTIVICSCTAMIMLLAPQEMMKGLEGMGTSPERHVLASGTVRSDFYCGNPLAFQFFHISWNSVLCKIQCGISFWG